MTLESRWAELSEPNLAIEKRIVRERIEGLQSPQERQTALGRIKSIPQLQDIYQQYTLSPPPAIPAPLESPQESSWWQKPLDWIKSAEEGFGAIVTAPFTPSVPGTEGLGFFEREKAEYSAWDEPSFQVEPLFRLPWTPKEIRERPWTIGVKGAVETLPWVLIPSAGGIAARLGGIALKGGRVASAARVGLKVVEPLAKAEKVIQYPIAKPLEYLGGKIAPKAPEFFSVPASEAIEKTITKDDWQRRIARWFGRKPVFKDITESVCEKAATVE